MTNKVKKCLYDGCGKEFEYKQDTAKYCSPSCKNKHLKQKKGLGSVSNAPEITNPLLIPETTNYANYGNVIPQWLFQDKVNLINKLQTELQAAITETRRLENENRDLKHDIKLTQVKHDLEANTKPSPINGIVEAASTPEGLTAIINGIGMLLQNRNSAPAQVTQLAAPTATDPAKQSFLNNITTAVNGCNNNETLGKAAFIFANSLTPEWNNWLTQTYNDIMDQAQKRNAA